jgi:hypothetical protein
MASKQRVSGRTAGGGGICNSIALGHPPPCGSGDLSESDACPGQHAAGAASECARADGARRGGRGGAGAPLRTPAARRARACRAAAHSSAHLAGRRAQPTQSHTVACHHKRTPTTCYGTETPDLGAPETDGRLHAPPSHACLTSCSATVPAAGGWSIGAQQGKGWHASLFWMSSPCAACSRIHPHSPRRPSNAPCAALPTLSHAPAALHDCRLTRLCTPTYAPVSP